jgi:hypothetical protein
LYDELVKIDERKLNEIFDEWNLIIIERRLNNYNLES